MRALIAVLLVSGIAALAAPAALTVSSYTDALQGAEIAASSTEGTFVGTASGALPGTWTVTVDHTPLSATGATITGGGFSVETALNGLPTLVLGTLAYGGTVTVTNPGSGCTKQTFAIYAPLISVGEWHAGGGSGLFTGTLTHYRYSLFGHCIVYSATITGGVSLTF
jgi:hypothetical protein